MIGTTLSHYRITGELGAGGMGEVYRATDTQLGREVAIKVLPTEVGEDPERLARFKREAQLLAALNHPHVAAIYGLEQVDERPFLVLELVEGQTLAERLERGPLPVDEAIGIAGQIAAAVEAAHEKGIVHRDLKPANVKLTPEGTVKVLDFGLAKAYSGDASASTSVDLSQSPTLAHTGTRAGVILGTAGYMSPEQARGRSLDKRADVWAFGVVLYEMLTGEKLFTGETASDVLAGVLRAEIDLAPLPAGTPPRVEGLLRRCLDRDPRSRLRDIGEARIALESSGSEPAQDVQVASASKRGPGIAAWSGWALAAVLLASTAWLWWRLGAAPGPEVVRTSILAPPDASVEYNPGHPGPPAISPDGRMLAFAARNEDGELRLYVRPLDELVARPLVGTEGAGYPFWSPDSRSIGYFTGSRLAIVDAEGGGHRVVCEAQNAKGGAWSPDGTIVFTPTATDALFAVPATGGDPVKVTTLDAEAGDVSHRLPFFLPDGRHVLFVARRPGQGEDTHAVMVASLDDGTSRALLRSPAAAEYSQGHLFYMRGSALMARPFDPRSLELSGDAYQVAEDVMLVLGTARAAFSVARNGLVAYQPGELSQTTRLEWVDRAGEPLASLGETAMPAFDLRLSPDGQRLAVGLADFTVGTLDLWTYDVARGVPTRFTFEPSNEANTIWSPDGDELIYARSAGGGGVGAAMYRKSYGGSEEAALVLDSEGPLVPTDWSADGSLVVFTKGTGAGVTNIWLLPLAEGAQPRSFRETRFSEAGGRLSPDGRWLAFQSDESGRMEVYVTTFPEPGRRWQISSAGGRFPHWTRGGAEVVYQEETGQLVAVAVAASGEGLQVGRSESLFLGTPQAGDFLRFSVTPDGERFIVARPERDASQQPMALLSGWAALAPS